MREQDTDFHVCQDTYKGFKFPRPNKQKDIEALREYLAEWQREHNEIKIEVLPKEKHE